MNYKNSAGEDRHAIEQQMTLALRQRDRTPDAIKLMADRLVALAHSIAKAEHADEKRAKNAAAILAGTFLDWGMGEDEFPPESFQELLDLSLSSLEQYSLGQLEHAAKASAECSHAGHLLAWYLADMAKDGEAACLAAASDAAQALRKYLH